MAFADKCCKTPNFNGCFPCHSDFLKSDSLFIASASDNKYVINYKERASLSNNPSGYKGLLLPATNKNTLELTEMVSETFRQGAATAFQHGYYYNAEGTSNDIHFRWKYLDEWDGSVMVGNENVKIKKMEKLLATKYAFVSGAHVNGSLLVSFPDSRVCLSFEDYSRIINYLLQMNENVDCTFGCVLLVDRRLDKWSSIRTLFQYLLNYFPAYIEAVFVLKPESILQKALEVGYRPIVEDYSCNFKVIMCNSIEELHSFISSSLLTVDFGGQLEHNHLEWLKCQMEVECLRCRAAVIARSLEAFTGCLADSELPNDAISAEQTLNVHTAERDAIHEDFQLALHQGHHLLKRVRQAEFQTRASQLSPTRLRNVITVQRVLLQLDDTYRSFHRFWSRHERRIVRCLELRQFEQDFRKLQSKFAASLLSLEDFKDVDLENADNLIRLHSERSVDIQADIAQALELNSRGEELMAVEKRELDASLKPKCAELLRMADCMDLALSRRAHVLRTSAQMHQQIRVANDWCSEGVDILSSLPLDNSAAGHSISKWLENLDAFIESGSNLHLTTIISYSETANDNEKSIALLNSPDISTLVKQVINRIEDVRRLCENCQAHFHQKTDYQGNNYAENINSLRKEKKKAKPSPKREIRVLHPGAHRTLSSPLWVRCPVTQPLDCPDSPSTSKTGFIVQELLLTEENYVMEMDSVVQYYIREFQNSSKNDSIPLVLRGKEREIFGNLEDIRDFHRDVFLKDLRKASKDMAQAAGAISRCFRERLDYFYLYNIYCQNKPKSESLRQTVGEHCGFFVECQRRAGHRLPLGAYLLKPVQRITKYQLILKELLRSVGDSSNDKLDLELSLNEMLALLRQLNSSLQHAQIYGYTGDLVGQGQLLLHSNFSVWPCKRTVDKCSVVKLRRGNKVQDRRLFLFDRVLLFCKRRPQPTPDTNEYYEFKLEIQVDGLSFSEENKANDKQFEIWPHSMTDGFILLAETVVVKREWMKKLQQIINNSRQTSNSPNFSTVSAHQTSCLQLQPVVETPYDGSRTGDANNNPKSFDISISKRLASKDCILHFDPDNNLIQVTMTAASGTLNGAAL